MVGKEECQKNLKYAVIYTNIAFRKADYMKIRLGNYEIYAWRNMSRTIGKMGIVVTKVVVKNGTHGKVITRIPITLTRKSKEERETKLQRFSIKGSLIGTLNLFYESNQLHLCMSPEIRNEASNDMYIHFIVGANSLCADLGMKEGRFYIDTYRLIFSNSLPSPTKDNNLTENIRNKMLEMFNPEYPFDMDGFIDVLRDSNLPKVDELVNKWDGNIITRKLQIDEGMKLTLKMKNQSH